MKINTDDFIDPMSVITEIRNMFDLRFTSLEAV